MSRAADWSLKAPAKADRADWPALWLTFFCVGGHAECCTSRIFQSYYCINVHFVSNRHGLVQYCEWTVQTVDACLVLVY